MTIQLNKSSNAVENDCDLCPPDKTEHCQESPFTRKYLLCYYSNTCNLGQWQSNEILPSKRTVFWLNISLQCHVIPQKKVWYADFCLRNICNYYHCWTQFCCLIFLWKLWYVTIQKFGVRKKQWIIIFIKEWIINNNHNLFSNRCWSF